MATELLRNSRVFVHRGAVRVLLAVIACVVVASPALATRPVYDSRILYIGDIWLTATNDGTFGSAPVPGTTVQYFIHAPQFDMDRMKIDWHPSLEFPGGSKRNYLFAASILVGGIVGTDTLVSTSLGIWAPLAPEFVSYEKAKVSVGNPVWPEYEQGSIAGQVITTTYSDTTVWISRLTPDQIEGRLHRPLGLAVRQRVLGWASEFARRLVVVDLWITNMSGSAIAKPAVGVGVIPWPMQFDSPALRTDGICGYVSTVRSTDGEYMDTISIAWAADADGNPSGEYFAATSLPDAIGARILNATGMPRIAFNWWAGFSSMEQNWGPSLRINHGRLYGSSGVPPGDRATYALMTNGEVDYDQVYATHDSAIVGWEHPFSDPKLMRNIASGNENAFVLSRYGGSDWLPGDSVNFCFAFIVGEGFHRNPSDYAQTFNVKDPSRFMQTLDFSDLIANARWAEWVRDLPGVDTDSNGYAGEYHLFNCDHGECDTNWYKGDGVPDWGAPQPPPNPKVTVETRPHEVTLRWNGAPTETTKDFFSRRRDFEGYRVYNARFNTLTDYALLTSWDIPDDFVRVTYDEAKNTWKQISYPLTVAGWQHEMGDPNFDPTTYPKPSMVNAYRDTVIDTVRDVAGLIISIAPKERLSYWEPQGPNRGNEFGDSDGRVHKNMVQRVAVRDTVIGEDTLQYGVYEFVFEDLNAAIPLWFAVTTMDFGDYRSNVGPQESTPQSNTQFLFPQNSADIVVDSNLQVYTYPNPYKIHFKDVFGRTTNYFQQGYEGAGLPQMDERERRIWFANLPDTATIRIYSLDGDLIREIHHPDKFLTQYNSIVGWDLISRNTQAVTSGIYIWRVDSRLGTQVGKIVIIK